MLLAHAVLASTGCLATFTLNRLRSWLNSRILQLLLLGLLINVNKRGRVNQSAKAIEINGQQELREIAIYIIAKRRMATPLSKAKVRDSNVEVVVLGVEMRVNKLKTSIFEIVNL